MPPSHDAALGALHCGCDRPRRLKQACTLAGTDCMCAVGDTKECCEIHMCFHD